MLILNNGDLAKCVSYDEMLKAVEKAYTIYEDGSFFMPDRTHVDYRQKNILYMPCFLDHVFGTKVLTIFPENAKKGVPTLDGLMLLNDYETGKTVAMMDGITITALRTGAVGGTAIRYMTPETVQSVGLIGAGVQGYYQVVYACMVRGFRKIFLYDAFRKDYTDFIMRLRKEISPDVEIVVSDTAEALLRESEVIINATPATAPTMPNDAELLKGKHFVGIGSYKPNMREYPDALFSLLENVYIDTDIALEESGDLIQPIEAGLLKTDQLRRFGRLMKSPEEIMSISRKTTLFKSVGMSIFDVVAADLLYHKALEYNLGYSVGSN